MNTTVKLGFFLGLCLLLQGCVGGAIATSKTTVYKNPVFREYKYTTNSFRLVERDPLIDTNSVTYNSEWLLANYGKPTSISRSGHSGQDETWTYVNKDDPIWKGVLIFAVIVPVPLMLPVSHEHDCFVLHDGRVVSARRITGRMVGGFVGFDFAPCHSRGFGAFPIH